MPYVPVHCYVRLPFVHPLAQISKSERKDSSATESQKLGTGQIQNTKLTRRRVGWLAYPTPPHASTNNTHRAGCLLRMREDTLRWLLIL